MSVENRSSATDALQKSCYYKIDFGISEDATVFEVVQRFAAYNIGALAVTDADKKVVGIVSERDYVSKVITGGGFFSACEGIAGRLVRLSCLCTCRILGFGRRRQQSNIILGYCSLAFVLAGGPIFCAATAEK